MRNRYIGGNKKPFIFYFFWQSSYSELVLIQAHCSLVLNFLRFSMFDGSGYLLFEMLKMLKNSIF